MVWSLADRIKNLIEKKWPGLSDSDRVTGGLKELTARELVIPIIPIFTIDINPKSTIKKKQIDGELGKKRSIY